MDLSKFSFGATSAITTGLALIVGLHLAANPRLSIIAALLIIAIADNISDSLGIHVYRESQCSLDNKKCQVYTLTNFSTRLLITFTFIALVFFLPLNLAVIASIIIGLVILSIMSYYIALSQKINPYIAILQHLSVTILVIIISQIISYFIKQAFGLI